MGYEPTFSFANLNKQESASSGTTHSATWGQIDSYGIDIFAYAVDALVNSEQHKEIIVEHPKDAKSFLSGSSQTMAWASVKDVIDREVA